MINNPTPLVHTVTDDQAFEISVHHDSTQALLFLLGQALWKNGDEPNKEEREGIMNLVRIVGGTLSDSLEAAFKFKSDLETPSQNVA